MASKERPKDKKMDGFQKTEVCTAIFTDNHIHFEASVPKTHTRKVANMRDSKRKQRQ